MNGIVAAFATETALRGALARLRADRLGEIETYTPKALAEDETGTGSPMPVAIFLAGILGAAAMFALETYADVLNWPVNVGGRPAFSWPAFVPIAFEFGILCAMTTGIVGYLVINRLPRLWEPIDECDAMRQAMRAEWVVAVRNDDRREIERAHRILLALQPLSIEEISPALVDPGVRRAVWVLAVLAALAGCDDMTDQPRQKQYSPEVGPAQQPKGIVEFNEKPEMAPPLTLALVERGQERFRIYCTPCHSELGDGDGMIVQRGFPHPPSYHSAVLIAAPTQHFYDVITHGFGVMYSFADRVQPSDRWAIAAYIRALQLSQAVPANELTPEQRKSLP